MCHSDEIHKQFMSENCFHTKMFLQCMIRPSLGNGINITLKSKYFYYNEFSKYTNKQTKMRIDY